MLFCCSNDDRKFHFALKTNKYWLLLAIHNAIIKGTNLQGERIKHATAGVHVYPDLTKDFSLVSLDFINCLPKLLSELMMDVLP